mmetsp:Transcript_30670/g.56045  ORF Transcript_30670/g.56045 Transcript_30670/m.56045 type:complete len:459 (+) Transcript_30670:57-1433(+)
MAPVAAIAEDQPRHGIYVRQLCEKAVATMSTVPPDQRATKLAGYLRKWSGGKDKINFHQFRGALQSLSLPLHAAGEVFATFGSIGESAVDVLDVSNLLMSGTAPSLAASQGKPPVIRPPPLPQLPGGGPPGATPPATSGSVVRAAGTSMVGAGIGTPQGSTGGRSRSSSQQASRGATPVRRQPSGSAVSSSRKGGPPEPSPAADESLDLAGGLVDRFRSAVLHRGGCSGIHGIARLFRIMDDDGNRSLSPAELQSGLADMGMKLSLKDAQLLLAAIDRHNIGAVTFNDFLASLRGPMSQQRQKLVDVAFRILDKTGNGVVTIDDVQNRFNAKTYPDVMSGRVSEHDALEHFLSQFDGVNKDGCITRDEFMSYYASVSASVDDDTYFELMMRNAWHIAGGEGQAANTANARILVTMNDGSQCIVAIQNDLGLDLDDPGAVRAHLDAQGLHNAVGYEVAS